MAENDNKFLNYAGLSTLVDLLKTYIGNNGGKIDKIYMNDSTVVLDINNKSVTIPLATATQMGLMSSADYIALHTTLPNNISTNSSNISQEITNRENAINEEVTNRNAAIGVETTNRTKAISDEATARQNADSSLQTNINNEVTARQSADTELQTQINNIVNIASGKTKSYVLTFASNSQFNSQEDDILLANTTELTLVDSTTILVSSLKISDIILVKETNVPDRWVSNIDTTNNTVTLSKMETSKVDLSSYLKKEDLKQEILDTYGTNVLNTNFYYGLNNSSSYPISCLTNTKGIYALTDAGLSLYGNWVGGNQYWFCDSEGSMPSNESQLKGYITYNEGNYYFAWHEIDSTTGESTDKIVKLHPYFDSTGNDYIITKGYLDTYLEESATCKTALTANKLSNTSAIGSANKPVYFSKDGVPVACSYTLGDACTYSVETSKDNISSNAITLPTSGAVADYIDYKCIKKDSDGGYTLNGNTNFPSQHLKYEDDNSEYTYSIEYYANGGIVSYPGINIIFTKQDKSTSGAGSYSQTTLTIPDSDYYGNRQYQEKLVLATQSWVKRIGYANSATQLVKIGSDNITQSAVAVGSATKPVYFNNGLPVACTYNLGSACAYTASTSKSDIKTGATYLPTAGAIADYVTDAISGIELESITDNEIKALFK